MNSENEVPSLLELFPESQKKTRISYTREFLLSIPESNECKKLPYGFDESILRKTRISYTREFLLSISESNVCKKLPYGFDESILSNLDESYSIGPEQQRDSGGGSLPYNSSGSYYQKSSGRWDTRSSGSSDKDADSLTDHNAFLPERRYGNQYRRQWQQTEHDGLLGSGAFPRAHEQAGGPAPRGRGNGSHQLSKSSEPYQPPRPYKAAPFTRKDHIDSLNDETFGFSECSSQDKAEEERKRRASFETMRKEQHKSFHEKQMLNSDYQKEKRPDDVFSVLQTIDKDKDGIISLALPQGDASRNSSVFHAPMSRPVVPPGFTNATAEKKFQPQSSNTVTESEIRNGVSGSTTLDNITVGQGNRVQSTLSGDTSRSETKNMDDHVAVQELVISSSTPELSEGAITADDVISGLEEFHICKDDVALLHDQQGAPSAVDSSRQDTSISILEKIFSPISSQNYDNSTSQNSWSDVKEDEAFSAVVDSSKFSDWFFEEGSKSAENISAMDLLAWTAKIENSLPPTKSNGASAQQYLQGYKADNGPLVLTCVDVEQSMLAAASNSVDHAQKQWTSVDGQFIEPEENVDDEASQHLLSLLQKGSEMTKPSLEISEQSIDPPVIFDMNDLAILGRTVVAPDNNSGKSVKLEALFGAAFMNELHSAEAPVSVRTNSSADHNYNLPSFSEGAVVSQWSNGRPGNLVGAMQDEFSNVSVTEMGYRSSLTQDANPRVHLPAEETLLAVNDPAASTRNQNLFPPNNLNAMLLEQVQSREEMNYNFHNPLSQYSEHFHVASPPGGPSYFRAPFAGSGNHYHALQGRHNEYAAEFMDHAGRIFPKFDEVPHRGQQPQFMGQEAFHSEPYHHHLLPANIHPEAFCGAGAPPFDPAAFHFMLQNMQAPGNYGHFRPHELPRAVPSHPMQHIPGHNQPEMPDVNISAMHRRHPQSVMPMSGDRSEVLERLSQMELGAKPKQLHPAVAGHGFYASEFGMNVRY